MRKVNAKSIIDNSKMNKFLVTVFVLCLFAVIFDGYDMNVYGTTLSSLMKELSLNATQTGILASTAQAGMIIGAIVFGMLADKIGRKKVKEYHYDLDHVFLQPVYCIRRAHMASKTDDDDGLHFKIQLGILSDYLYKGNYRKSCRRSDRK